MCAVSKPLLVTHWWARPSHMCSSILLNTFDFWGKMTPIVLSFHFCYKWPTKTAKDLRIRILYSMYIFKSNWDISKIRLHSPSNALATSTRLDQSRLEAVSGSGNIGLLAAWAAPDILPSVLGGSCVALGDNLQPQITLPHVSPGPVYG